MNGERAGHRGRGEIVVCGAGAAGMAAAIAAARVGAAVRLIELRPDVGGTAADCLIHTLGGLFDSAGELINDGLPRELAERLTRADSRTRRRRIGRAWVLNVDPGTYRRVVRAWLAEETRIRIDCNSRVVRADVGDGLVTDLQVCSNRRTERLRPRAVVDASGCAALVRLVEKALVDSDALRAAGGLIFTLRGVEPGAVAFPRGVAAVHALRSAAAEGRLPPECAHAWLDTGLDEDEVYVKLFVPHGRSNERPPLQLQETIVAVTDLLRELPGFAEVRVERTGRLGVRDGGRVHGEYALTAGDVRQGRRFPDAVCRAAWPIEYWHPEDGLSLEYLPDGQYYEIPLRTLQARGYRNLYIAGKCLSADRLAQASARVVGTCWAMGEAAGRAAAGVTG